MFFPFLAHLGLDTEIVPKATLTDHLEDGVARLARYLEASLLSDRFTRSACTPFELRATLVLFQVILF